MGRISAAVTMMSVLALTSPAYGQDAGTAGPFPQSPQAEMQEPSQPDGLSDIVVTAQRRSESLQRAAVAVAVVDSNSLIKAGVTASSQLGGLVPALSAQPSGGANTVFFLRGVGNFTVNGYSDPAVAFNYDGVYMGRPTSTSGTFYDIARIEVLKGPQGTLYGRNATAGAINVIPQEPKLGTFGGSINASFGNYNAISVQAAANIPIGEHSALRVSGNVINRDGYLSDGTSDEVGQGIRLQFLTEAIPDLKIRIAADYSHAGGRGGGASYGDRYVYNAATGSYTAIASGLGKDIGLLDPRSQAYRTANLYSPLAKRNVDPIQSVSYLNNDFYGVKAELEYKSAAGTLTVLPAYRHSTLDNIFNVYGWNAWVQEKDDQFSLEGRFATERLAIFDAIVGGYYFDETVKGNYTFNQQVLSAYQNFTSKTKSYAAFGRLTAHVTDSLRLVGGLRYTHDKKQFDGAADVLTVICTQAACPNATLLTLTDSIDQLPMATPARGGAPVPQGTSGAILARATTYVNKPQSFSRATWRAGVEFDLGPRSLLYASFETGYRSGGYALSAGYETYQPEYIDAYTVGMKNRFFGNRLQLNLEAFIWKYRDQQVSHVGIDRAGNSGVFTENVGRSTNQGFEVETQFLPFENTLLNATVQYLDAKFDRFVYNTPVQVGPPATGCPAAISATDPSVYAVNCSGMPAYQSPKWTINMGIQQTLPIDDSHKIVASFDTQYKSSRYIGFEYLSFQRVGSTWQSNATLSFGSQDDSWNLSAFVANIENNRIPTTGPYYSFAASGNLITSAPRTYGLRGAIKF